MVKPLQSQATCSFPSAQAPAEHDELSTGFLFSRSLIFVDFGNGSLQRH